jgi:uncharacterized protein (TIGR03435 family)
MGRRPSVRLTAFLLATSVARLLGQGQTDPKALAFEVASIKPNTSDAVGVGGVGWGANDIRGRNQSPASLLRMAFGVQADQIINTPAWASRERFDINAKVAPGIVFNAMTMFQPLMRKLLEDRFQLKIHHETRELNVYRLVRVRSDRLGPKLTAAPANSCSAADQKETAAQVAAGRGCSAGPVPGGIRVQGMPLTTLTSLIAPSLERVVVDETGLTGNWDLDLTFVNQVQDANGDGPSLFTALEEQLGLKLESGRARVDVIVIDRLERPTPD